MVIIIRLRLRNSCVMRVPFRHLSSRVLIAKNPGLGRPGLFAFRKIALAPLARLPRGDFLVASLKQSGISYFYLWQRLSTIIIKGHRGEGGGCWARRPDYHTQSYSAPLRYPRTKDKSVRSLSVVSLTDCATKLYSAIQHIRKDPRRGLI